MKQKAEVLTNWIGTGTKEDSNRPSIADKYVLNKWEDITGQPSENLHPDPNQYVVRIECEDTVMAQIEADPNFMIIPNTLASAFDEFRSNLAKTEDKDSKPFWTVNQVKDAIGESPNKRNCQQIQTELIAYLKAAPKANNGI